jgi:hypothetical protein
MDETSLQFAQNILSQLDKLLYAVIAIVTSLLTQWYVHNWSMKREGNKILQEKAERLIMEIFALDLWARAVVTNKRVTDVTPLGRVHALYTLYFPAFEKEHDNLLDSISRLTDHAETPRGIQNEHRWDQVCGELYDKYVEASGRFVHAISHHVAKAITHPSRWY